LLSQLKSRRSVWLISLSLGMILFLGIALSACSTKQSANIHKVTLKIGYLPITHAVPLYIEDNESKTSPFKNFNLQLVKFGSWPDVAAALNAGKIDGASMLITLAMKGKEQGIDLKALALGHRDGNVLIGADDINKVSDLKGKTYAIPHEFSTHNILLYLMLKQAGMAYTDVHPVDMAPAEMPAALATNSIAGYVVAEPFGAISVVAGKGKVLEQSQDVWKNAVDCALVVRNDFIQKNQAATQEFVNAYVKAGDIAELKNANDEAVEMKYMNVKKDVLDLSLKWIKYDNLRLNEADYNQLSQYLEQMNLMKDPPAYKDFVDSSYFDHAQ